MKERYEKPELEIVEFDEADIITESNELPLDPGQGHNG